MIWLWQLRGDEIRCQEPILRTMMRESPFRFLTPFSAPGRRSHRTRSRFTTENTNTSRLTASLSRMRIHVERAAPQGLCLVCQGVLPFSRFDVVEDLLRVRLSNVDDCQTAEMSIVERRWSQARDGRRFRGDRPFARWSHRGAFGVSCAVIGRLRVGWRRCELLDDDATEGAQDSLSGFTGQGQPELMRDEGTDWTDRARGGQRLSGIDA